MRIFFAYSTFILTFLVLGCQESASKRGNSSQSDGAVLFRQYCVNCHGLDGALKTNGAKDLRYSLLSLEERILVITEGRNAMTGFKSILNETQILELAKYSQSLNQTTQNGH